MNSLKPNRFTLIEVVLALAVVSIALAAILPLMTVGLRATKDSIGDTYAADASEQFLHYMAAKCKKDWSTELGKLITSKPDPNGSSEPDIAAWTNITNANLYSTSDDNIFGIKQESGTMVDFCGVIRVWKSPVTSQTYSGSGWKPLEDGGYTYSAALNIEISWPVELPYNVRNKKYFYLEIFKPN